jgi:parallel beta-helix repeat protein
MSLSGCITEENPSNGNMITVGIAGSADFTSIQEAIDNASVNVTIEVSEGIYYEHLIINQSIILKGENAEKTIIDGNGTGDVIFIAENSRAAISGFTIRNSGTRTDYPNNDVGIEIDSSNNDINNNIIENNYIGIYSQKVTNNSFTDNIFRSNSGYGMYLWSDSNSNIVKDNIFVDNPYGLRIKGSRKNLIIQNMFQDNRQGLYFCCGATDNIAFHNSFINNSIWNAYDYVVGNVWDNGYPVGGNYWDNYNGTDSDGDGIGDIPHNISNDGFKRDRYPLMQSKISI